MRTLTILHFFLFFLCFGNYLCLLRLHKATSNCNIPCLVLFKMWLQSLFSWMWSCSCNLYWDLNRHLHTPPKDCNKVNCGIDLWDMEFPDILADPQQSHIKIHAPPPRKHINDIFAFHQAWTLSKSLTALTSFPPSYSWLQSFAYLLGGGRGWSWKSFVIFLFIFCIRYYWYYRKRWLYRVINEFDIESLYQLSI